MDINQNDLNQKIGVLLDTMSSMLQQQKANSCQLIQMAEDILNFLFVLKSQNTTVTLDQDKLDQMIAQLPKIQFS